MTTQASQLNKLHVDSDLYADYYQSIYKYVRRRLSDVDRAQDVTQDACLRLLRMQQSARVILAPQAYGLRIAANLMSDRWKHEKRETVIFDSRLADKCVQNWTRSAPDPREILELEQKLLSTLSLLPPLQSEVLIRRKRDGASLTEIASQLGISVHTVKKYLFLAIEHCRSEGTDQ